MYYVIDYLSKNQKRLLVAHLFCHYSVLQHHEKRIAAKRVQ